MLQVTLATFRFITIYVVVKHECNNDIVIQSVFE